MLGGGLPPVLVPPLGLGSSAALSESNRLTDAHASTVRRSAHALILTSVFLYLHLYSSLRGCEAVRSRAPSLAPAFDTGAWLAAALCRACAGVFSLSLHSSPE